MTVPADLQFQSGAILTVVDTKTRKFVREIETPGCALVYPTGPRSFFCVCGDGSLLLVSLDDAGVAQQKRTQPLFEHGRRSGDGEGRPHRRTWYFVSFAGRIYPLDADCGARAAVNPAWWLTSDVERKAGWRPGGVQPLAENSRQLAALRHHASRGVVDAQRSGQGRLGIRCRRPAARAAVRP